jgi:hypothetical protein
MSSTLDERARAAGYAVRLAAELRPAPSPDAQRRAPARVLVTAVVLVIALSVGVFFALRAASPRKGGAASQPSGRYEASTTVLAITSAHRTSVVTQDALLLRIGVVPSRVADQLGHHATPQRLVNQVHVTTDKKVGSIKITSIQTTAARAITIVNAFANQLVRYLAQIAQTAYNVQVQKAADLTQKLGRERANVQTQLLRNPTSVGLKNRALALQTAFTNASTAYAKVVSESVPYPPLRLVEAADAKRIGSTHTTSRRSLDIALAAIALLILGGALGFGLGRHRTAPQT